MLSHTKLACLMVVAAGLAACDSPTTGLSTQNGYIVDSGAGPSMFEAGVGVGLADGGSLPGFDASSTGQIGVTSSAIPCAVAAIVSQKCALCHGPTPKFNAPMRLVSVSDFKAAAPTSAGQTVYQAAAARINATDSARLMPPPGTVAALTPAERTSLSQWLNAGAAGEATGCAVSEPPTAAPDAGTTATAPSSGISVGPYPGWDQGVECYKMLAHDGSKKQPYQVGVAVDKYVSFSLMPPWQGTRYVRAFRAVVDNAQALHHFLLFNQGEPVTDGSISSGLPVHPTGELLQGWAPGGSDLFFSPDIGTEMSGSNGYVLEMHYNSSDASARDASGVEVCVTANKPANVITRSWVGTDNINSVTVASGVCDPSSSERIHIVLGTPHMHLKGRHMRVVINRATGKNETVHDEAFAFENQRDYPEDIWLEPGDRITTTCTFSEPAMFGQGTTQEMCYWFAMHYPAGALADDGLVSSLLHGANTCLGM